MIDNNKKREYQIDRLTQNGGEFKMVSKEEADIFELQLKIKQLEHDMMCENRKKNSEDGE